jgi:hypothetical protein
MNGVVVYEFRMQHLVTKVVASGLDRNSSKTRRAICSFASGPIFLGYSPVLWFVAIPALAAES